MGIHKKRISKRHIDLKQDGIGIILTKLSVEELVDNTVVDVFDSSTGTDGYQRPLIRTQVNSIFEYFKTAVNAILPTSIILAINKNDFEAYDDYFEISNKFRIIDGQHRIAAMEKYLNDYNENDDKTDDEKQIYTDFVSWEYPVNIMLLDKNDVKERYIEIRAFVDINKKGRKLTTDLADTNIKNIQRKFDKLYQKDAIHHISTTIVEKLMQDPMSVWFESIKVGDNNNNNNSKLIGISSFKLSIMSIVRMYLFDSRGNKASYSMSEILITADFLYLELNQFWITVGDRWEEAFYWDTDLGTYRIDSDYNIQKSLGVSSLHRIIKHCYRQSSDFAKGMESAQNIISTTEVEYSSWEVGGEFSNYTSGSGHNKIKNLIIESATSN